MGVSADRLPEIEKAAASVGPEHYARRWALDYVPWLVAEVKRLREAVAAANDGMMVARTGVRTSDGPEPG